MSRSKSPEKRVAGDLRAAADGARSRHTAEKLSARETSGQAHTFNPQTPPQRFIPSTYSSPGSILGKEEDAVIFELSPRFLLAGIEGESHPQCRLNFCPSANRRVGDYRIWLHGHKGEREDLEEWGRSYALWRNDTHDLDLGLLSDKLERMVREACNKHLLIDAGAARLVVVLPSLVPHPVLETIFSTLFERWRFPSITLLPSPTMSTVSAGLRSSLVVEIGWEETVVTTVYEYRELSAHRSNRGMRLLTEKVARALQKLVKSRSDFEDLRFDLDFVEDLLTRAIPALSLADSADATDQVSQLSLNESEQFAAESAAAMFEVDWPSTSTTSVVQIPKRLILSEVQTTFFDEPINAYADDDETAVPRLLFKALLGMSPDVRAVCQSRIVFTGGLSDVTGVRDIVLRQLTTLINKHGWTAIKGQHLRPQRAGVSELAHGRSVPADAIHNVNLDAGKDYIEDRLRQARARRAPPPGPAAEIREVRSLGPWSGASLLSGLKIRGFVEVERERYLAHGLAGAGRDSEISVVPPPQRMSSFGIPKANKPQDRTSWTLAGWG